MLGLVLALLSGFAFAIDNIFMRKGMHRSDEAFSPVPISLFLGTMLFGISLFISGEVERLASLSWLGLSALAGAGVLHFLLGRLLNFTSIRFIGANRAVPVTNFAIVFAVLLGIFLLGESLTVSIVLAVLFIVGGVILISTTGNSKVEKSGVPGGSLAKGVLAALGAALCWGISPTLVKIGLKEVGSPLLAAFVSFSTASVVVGVSLFHPRNNEKLRRLDRTSLIPFIFASIASSAAMMLNYTALDYSPVSLVAPLMGSAKTLLIFPLSFLINREIEAFDLRIIMGAVMVVVGVFLIFWVT